MGTSHGPRTLEHARSVLATMPTEAMISAGWVADLLGDPGQSRPSPVAKEPVTEPPSVTWCERLWTAPAETRIGVRELVEAVGRLKHWVYRHSGPSATDRLSCRKLDGELVFVVGEIREWLRDHEQVVGG